MWNLTIIYKGEVKDIGNYKYFAKAVNVLMGDLTLKHDVTKINQFTITRIESDLESELDDD